MQVIPLHIYDSMLEKRATSKWRSLQRAGELGASSVSRLKKRGFMKPLREIKGIEKGNKAIQRKLGAEEINLPRSFRHVSKHLANKKYKKAAGAGVKLVKDVIKHPIPMPSAKLSGKKPVFTVADPFNILYRPSTKMSRRGLNAVVKRHELDELRHITRENKIKFGIGSAPENKNQVPGPKMIAGVKGIQKVVSTLSPKRGKRMRENPAYRSLINQRVIVGMHADPRVIMREAGHMKFMPKKTSDSLKMFREGEKGLARKVGTTYDKLSPSNKGEYRRLRKNLAAGSEESLQKDT